MGRHFRNERRRPANETERRRVVHEGLELGTADSPSRPAPCIVDRSCDRLPQLHASLLRQRAQLGLVRELVGCPSAVEETNLLVRDGERMVQHGAQRGYARAARNEDEPLFGGSRRKRERSKRALDVDGTATLENQMRSRVAGRVDAHEQLQAAVAPHLLGRPGE